MQGTWGRKRNLSILFVWIVVAIPLHLVATVVVVQIVVYIDLAGVASIVIPIVLIKILLPRSLAFLYLSFFKGWIDFKLLFDPSI